MKRLIHFVLFLVLLSFNVICQNVIVVKPVESPTPENNDFTVIENAVNSAANGNVIDLQGTFNWTEINAYEDYGYSGIRNLSSQLGIRILQKI